MIRFAARGLLVGVALPLLVLAGGPGAAAQSGTPSATASPATAGDITIYRDEMGVPHVYADTAPAVFFGGSYAIAQDRLAQSELESRALLGRLAEVAGPSMIEADKTARIALPTDASMQAQYDRLPADYQAIMKGMYDGWIKRVREVKADPALLPYEFKEWGIEPTEWTMLEFLKVMGMVFKYYGTGGGGRELTNLALYKDLVAKHGEADAKKIFDGMKAAQKARQGTLAAKDAELAALREETKRAEAALHKLVCGKAIREAARRAGCAPKFLGAVEAALLADLDLVTEDDAEGKAVAALADGGSIEFAVATFLGSDDGEAFVEPVETMGPVVKAVRSLH